LRVSELKKTIREVPDFPKPGIRFYDLSTLFRDGAALRAAVDRMAERFRGEPIDALAAVEARGFILGGALAHELGTGLIMLRKPGKLPAEAVGETYTLEYGDARIELHRDAVSEGQRIIVVDDVLATGGTAAAAGRLVERLGGRLEGYAFIVELGFLNGREQLGSSAVFSLIRYD
jgi:adenine phosphoribosyltransferase